MYLLNSHILKDKILLIVKMSLLRTLDISRLFAEGSNAEKKLKIIFSVGPV